MRFLLDEHLPTGLCTLISDLGHECLHVKTEGWVSASDGDIWRSAQILNATMVSKDSDFLSLARRDGRAGSLLHLNLGNIANAALYDALRRAWPRLVERLERGDVVVELRR